MDFLPKRDVNLLIFKNIQKNLGKTEQGALPPFGVAMLVGQRWGTGTPATPLRRKQLRPSILRANSSYLTDSIRFSSVKIRHVRGLRCF